jgi:hypothetical protein
MLHFLETLSKISIHKAIKSGLSRLIILITCVAAIYSWCLLDHSLSMREVIWGGAAHFLFLLIDYTDFLHLLWQFFHCSSKRIATLLICIGTVWWQSSLIYLHPFMDIIWLCLLQLGLCWWWFLLNYPLHPLLSRNFILFLAHCHWLPERLRDTGFILKETLYSVIIGLVLNLIYAARAYVISF